MNGPSVPEPCDHHWISTHQPGHILYWVRVCSVCHEADWDNLDEQITERDDTQAEA
jgi:hypothetical protein